MVLNNVAEIFAPMQIMVVLVIALIVFGPKRLPELGKSIGTALRDLNKAKNDMMRSFSLDHEPEPPRYDNNYNSYDNSYNSGYQYNPVPERPDLSDYTIAGVPPNETSAVEGAVARGTNGYDPAASADYMIATSHKPAESSPRESASSASAPPDGPQGEHHV
jgi:sec-independent protein translocase protein TatA